MFRTPTSGLGYEHLPVRRSGTYAAGYVTCDGEGDAQDGRRGTQPELKLRRALHRRGLRFLVDVSPRGTNRRRRVDIFLRGVRIAVFVDGCFWHSCPVHAHLPRSNRDWWRRKLEGVVLRDRDADAELTAAGWLVVRVWEHEDPDVAADRIAQLARERRGHRRS
ncbi:very short patch repair endonuclease [Saccharopolyspora sp. NPDC050642]|uniref:very short patch repair endonuclease n=1 Tax=Saccharopolyspora sp. NPDC050642 TaxID=3157099 RepID=UPI0033F2462B